MPALPAPDIPLLAPPSASEVAVEVGATACREALAKVARLEEAAAAAVVACRIEDGTGVDDGAEMAVIDDDEDDVDEDNGVLTDVERVELVVGTTTLEVVGTALLVVGAT